MAKKNIKHRAAFITVEGLEGCGKSSVVACISRFLRKKGYSLTVFREPGSTKLGEAIRAILLDKTNSKLSPYTELLLYLAARTQLIEEKLLKAFQRYDVVICDRFFDSTIVYQGYALGLGKVAQEAVKLFSLGVEPDLTLLLDVPPKVGLSRIKRKDRIESRPLAFHNKLRKGYRSLARKYPERISVIDARGTLREVCQRALKVLETIFTVR